MAVVGLEDAARRLAERTLAYVGPVDDPKLECDAEMRKLAQDVLATLAAMSDSST